MWIARLAAGGLVCLVARGGNRGLSVLPSRSGRATARGAWLMTLTLIAVSACQVTPPETREDINSLTTAILAHVRQSLPPAAASSVDAERSRVHSFASVMMTDSVDPPDAAKLQATAIAGIDAANASSATADSLVHAAIAAVSHSVGGYDTRTTCEPCVSGTAHSPLPPRTMQSSTIRVLTLPNLNMKETIDFRKPCSALDHYFDFPTQGVTGVILDLRGNQGGYLPAAVCVAGEFVKPNTPLFRVTTRSGEETLRAPTDAKRAPIGLPLVVFIDKDTESGALMLAASLRDVGRADLVGESKEHANDRVLALVPTRTGQDQFLVAVGHMKRLGGDLLSEGVQVDVAASPKNEESMLEAARTRLGEHSTSGAP
jgi:Peptidase family S41